MWSGVTLTYLFAGAVLAAKLLSVALGAPAAAPFPWLAMLHTVMGTLLVASRAGALNQWTERDHDAQMRRTLRRPIAAGRMDAGHALVFGAALSCTGILYLAMVVSSAASLLAKLTIGWYLLLYTPLKRVNPLCTRRSILWRHARVDRICGSPRQHRQASLAALRHPFSLAIPALHVDRLDV